MINNITKLFGETKPTVGKNLNNVYFFNKQNDVKIRTGWKNMVILILIAYFNKLDCLISQPVFTFTPNKVKIHLFYYVADLGSIIPPKLQSEFKYYLYRIGKTERDLEDWKKLNLTLNQLDELNKTAEFINEPKYLKRLRRSRKVKLWSYLIKLHLAYLKTNRLRDLTILLSKQLQMNVELELVRLKHPYHDSNILAQLIAINGNALTYRRIKLTVLKRSTILTKESNNNYNKPVLSMASPLVTKAVEGLNLNKDNTTNTDLSKKKLNNVITENKEIVSRLTGIKLRVAGRLARQRVVPKRTVENAYRGRVSKAKLNLVDSSTFTGKNRRGAYSIRVWLSHGIS